MPVRVGGAKKTGRIAAFGGGGAARGRGSEAGAAIDTRRLTWAPRLERALHRFWEVGRRVMVSALSRNGGRGHHLAWAPPYRQGPSPRLGGADG